MIKKILSALTAAFMLTAGLLSSGVTAGATSSLPFTDVEKDAWYYEAVEYSFENGLMNGMTPTTFEEKKPMTRAMFVTILCRIAKGEETITKAFSDVTDDKWYSGYVGWAEKNGVVGGYPDGTFLPENYISRQEMAKVISRFIGLMGIIPTRDRNALKSFADKENIAQWAADSVEEMRVSGILRGNEDETFNPEGILSRAEAATIVTRFHKMAIETALDEPTAIDYKVEGKDFYLLDAWDLYYSGSAITTGYNGTKVDSSGEIPTLIKDDNGRKVSHFYLNPENTEAKGNYYGFDFKILGIDPNKYPVVKIGYSSNAEVAAAVYSGGELSGTVTVTARDGYALIDLSGCGRWNDSSEQIVLTLMAEAGDISVTYLTAFKSVGEADSFSIGDYKELLNFSDPVDVEYSKIKDSILAGYKEDVCQAKEKIIESKNTVDVKEAASGGTVYYISSKNGDDDNNGLSPQTAWKTTDNLYKIRGSLIRSNLNAGDTVLFERGSVFYAKYPTNASGDYALSVYSGITYSSYGEGDKPLFTNACDFGNSRTGKWIETDVKNVYMLDYDLTIPDGCDTAYYDVGNIVFDGGKAWGIKVCVDHAATLENPGGYETVSSGWVTNGVDCYIEGGVKFNGLESLVNNLEFWHDHGEGRLYLRCNEGNPGDVFDDIVVSKHGIVVRGGGSDITIDNLAVKYTGSHGIQTTNVENLSVTNCEIGWCGGSSNSNNYKSRYGNGYENWDTADGLYVENNYVYQCYDTGITTQGSGIMKNISFSSNVLEYCNTGYELWTGPSGGEEGYIANCRVGDSYQLFAGYGFGVQRPLGNKNGASNLGQKVKAANYYNYVYENNIVLWCSYFCSGDGNYARGVNTEGVINKNNVYLMSGERGYVIRSRNNLLDLTGSVKTLYPYSKQYIGYVTSLGIENGSKFYYYDGYLNEGNVKGEELGVYYE